MAAFLDLLRQAAGPAAPPAAALEPWLLRAAQSLDARWPALRAQDLLSRDADETLGRVATVLGDHLPDDPEGLAALEGADLLLAAAAVAGFSAALTCFDEVLRTEVRRAVAPLDTTNALVDEVTQLVRERLLVAPPSGRAKLAEYSGYGSLLAWLRAVAVRLALNAKRPGGRELPVSTVPDQPLVGPDPELAVLRGRYREQFRAAFAVAVGALTARERTVLRLTTLDGLTLAQVGQMYAKDASTVSRWLAAARTTLLERTRDELSRALALSTAELDSVMRAADSELDVSISRLLESRTPAGG